MKTLFFKYLTLTITLSFVGLSHAQEDDAAARLKSAIGAIGSLKVESNQDALIEQISAAVQAKPEVVNALQKNASVVLGSAYKAFLAQDLEALKTIMSEAALEQLGGEEGLKRQSEDIAARSETTVESGGQPLLLVGEATDEGTYFEIGFLVSFVAAEVKDGAVTGKGHLYQVVLTKELVVSETTTDVEIQDALASPEGILLQAWVEQDIEFKKEEQEGDR